MDHDASREEALQGISAVEIWEEGVEGYIVQDQGRDPARKHCGSINIKQSTAILNDEALV